MSTDKGHRETEHQFLFPLVPMRGAAQGVGLCFLWGRCPSSCY